VYLCHRCKTRSRTLHFLDLARAAGVRRAVLLSNSNYLMAHALFTDLLTGMVIPDRAAWTAHAVLSFTRIDLLENLITTQLRTETRLRKEIQDMAGRILGHK
jgi:hypothetical protein